MHMCVHDRLFVADVSLMWNKPYENTIAPDRRTRTIWSAFLRLFSSLVAYVIREVEHAHTREHVRNIWPGMFKLAVFVAGVQLKRFLMWYRAAVTWNCGIFVQIACCSLATSSKTRIYSTSQV